MKRIKRLIREARELFPQCRKLQHQWVRKTEFLVATGRHARFTGGWVRR